MIGKLYSSTFQFFDVKKQALSFKNRPVLIIGDQRNNDYTVLPVSTVSRKENLDSEYDVEIIPQNYPKLNLAKISYVRTHKQTPLHRGSLHKEISDLKSEYPDLFLEIMTKVEKFNKNLIENSMY